MLKLRAAGPRPALLRGDARPGNRSGGHRTDLSASITRFARRCGGYPTRTGDDAAIIPRRLVDRLRMLELPAGQVRLARPNDCNSAPVAVDCDRLIANRSEPHRTDQAAFGSLPIAGSTGAPARAMLDLGGVDPEQANAIRSATKRVAVDNIRARTVDHSDLMSANQNVRNGSKLGRALSYY